MHHWSGFPVDIDVAGNKEDVDEIVCPLNAEHFIEI